MSLVGLVCARRRRRGLQAAARGACAACQSYGRANGRCRPRQGPAITAAALKFLNMRHHAAERAGTDDQGSLEDAATVETKAAAVARRSR